MMDTLTALHCRRSCRQYTEEPVSEDNIRALLEAAMVAPSAHNCQPWHFVIVKEQSMKEAVASLHPYIHMAKNAPLGILVCGNTSLEKTPGYWVVDCAAASQNILLAATALGLGAVWTGIYPLNDRIEAFKKLFALPDHIIPLTYLIVGHPAQEVKAMSRYDPAKISHEIFNVQKALG